jgi:hypothetical protein
VVSFIAFIKPELTGGTAPITVVRKAATEPPASTLSRLHVVYLRHAFLDTPCPVLFLVLNSVSASKASRTGSAMPHTGLAVVESRWWESGNDSVRPLFETVAGM